MDGSRPSAQGLACWRRNSACRSSPLISTVCSTASKRVKAGRARATLKFQSAILFASAKPPRRKRSPATSSAASPLYLRGLDESASSPTPAEIAPRLLRYNCWVLLEGCFRCGSNDSSLRFSQRPPVAGRGRAVIARPVGPDERLGPLHHDPRHRRNSFRLRTPLEAPFTRCREDTLSLSVRSGSRSRPFTRSLARQRGLRGLRANLCDSQSDRHVAQR